MLATGDSVEGRPSPVLCVHFPVADTPPAVDEDRKLTSGGARMCMTFDLTEFERILSERLLIAPHPPRVMYVLFAVQGRDPVALPQSRT